MKYSKKFMMLVLFGIGAFLCTPSHSFAEGEAISVDDFLKNQKTQTAAPVVDKKTPEAPKELTGLEKLLAIAKAEIDDKEVLSKKIDLAKKMHQIRPTRDQVDSAVYRVSLSFPQHERQGFVNAMGTMLNYNAIERISVDAMIETYTLKELSSMVEYYSKPEAISASNKMVSWAKLVQPEVANMIDKAMMRIKTGQ